jgi:hypothetical protein
MNLQKALPDQVFRVDKKIVITRLLPFQIFMIFAALIFLNGIKLIPQTLASSEFWLWVLGIIGVGVLLDMWTILYDRIEFKDSTITSYFNSRDSAKITDFVSASLKKTIYTNYLGFEYKAPKSGYNRFLLPYGYYSPKTLRSIMQEILKINPNIKLEDEFSKQIVDGTYKNKLLR